VKCLLDMDGVLVNFVQGISDALGRENPYLKRPLGAAAGEWDMPKLWGIPEAAFWVPCMDPEFWANLNWMPDGRRILELVEWTFGKENVCLLTSPGSAFDPACIGKVAWIKQHMPDYMHRVLFGSAKHFCAHAGSVLIDDRDKNIADFCKAGGRALLVPRPWNMGHSLGHSAVDQLDHLLMLLQNQEEAAHVPDQVSTDN
jgi:5'(3')-deoxyribonucleotidase